MIHTRVNDAALESLAGLTKLRRLNLDYTAVTDKGMAYLKLLPLAELRLDSAGITDAGAEQLKSMASLKVLNLYHTLVTEDAYRALAAALPQCKIVWDRDSSLPNRRGS